MNSKLLLLIISLMLCCLSKVVQADDISDFVFSGFVELSSDQSEDNTDFSQIEVILQTEDGKNIEKTQCSSNGFYLLPIYDRKSYIIKVNPIKESKFEPESVAIDLTDKSYDEIKKLTEKVYNFKFVGFTLASQVKAKFSDVGPANVKVALSNASGKKIGETTTDETGNFEFKNLTAGNYKVKLVKQQNDYFFDSNNEISCNLNWKFENTCTGTHEVTGYGLTGKVLNENQDVSGFTLFLYPSAQGTTAAQNPCNQPKVTNHPLKGKRDYICYSKVQKDGQFSFDNIPSGDYEMQLFSDQADSKIEIEPASYNFNVHNEKTVLNNVFKVEKFSVGGKVVDTKGTGIGNVKITLDGEQKATTKADGTYILQKVKFGTYTLEGNNEHLFFEPLHNLRLTSELTELPNVVLSFLHACGSVNVADDQLPDQASDTKVTVYLESKTEKRLETPGPDGTFCFEVKPGSYVVRPALSGANARDIILSPTKKDLTILNKPVLDLNFTRPRLTVTGKVTFLTDVSKTLKSTAQVLLKSASQGTVVQKFTPNADGSFAFKGILPGTYKLEIQQDALCWEEQSLDLPLFKNENVSDLSFKQTGYSFFYDTDKTIVATVIDPKNNSRPNVTFSPHHTKICLNLDGVHTIIPDDCYKYDTGKYTYDSSSGSTLQFKPLKNLVRGYIKLNSAFVKTDSQLKKAIPLTLPKTIALKQTAQDGVTNKESTTSLAIQYDRVEDSFIYFVFQDYLTPDTQVELVPKPDVKSLSSDDSSRNFVENLLFYPSIATFVVPSECQRDQPAAELEIRPGVVFEGTVSPAISDYEITVVPEDQQQKSQGPYKLSGGTFKLGPFVDSYKYNLNIDKKGYKFQQSVENTGQNKAKVTVQAHKLSSLEIKVRDTDENPVTGALIFISSTSRKNFLKYNNYTDETGNFITHELVKGDYYVRPVLKEYNFNPQQKTITIVDGGSSVVDIKAVRVAFSVYGRVMSLNQDGMEKLEVVATPEQGSEHPTESATTDNEGNYRIRGLIPTVSYTISVTNDKRIWMIKPQNISLTMQKQDIHNVDFIFFEKPSTGTVQGIIEYSKDFTEADINEVDLIRVVLVKNDEEIDSKLLQKFQYYEFSGLATGNYKIKVTYRRQKTLISDEIEVDVAQSEFESNPTVKKNIVLQKSSASAKAKYFQGSNFAAPIIVLALFFSIFNMDAITHWFKGKAESPTKSISRDKKKR